MALKDEWEDTKKVFQEYRSNWKKETNEKIPAKNKKILAWLFGILAVGIIVLPWVNLKNIAYFLDAIVAFLLLADGYPLAYVFGRRGLSRLVSVILSLLIGIVIVVIAGIYILAIPDIFR